MLAWSQARDVRLVSLRDAAALEVFAAASATPNKWLRFAGNYIYFANSIVTLCCSSIMGLVRSPEGGGRSPAGPRGPDGLRGLLPSRHPVSAVLSSSQRRERCSPACQSLAIPTVVPVMMKGIAGYVRILHKFLVWSACCVTVRPHD